MDQDIKTMADCSLMCTKTIAHCLDKGGEHASPEHIGLLMDCTEVCKLAASFACRGSSNHQDACGLCAEICTQCADECESMADDDKVMRQCAEVCRRCAEACERMS